jgi:hypothetical protein
MQRIVHDQPRSIREQNPAIPQWLEGFISRLLAKERDARFESADEVVEILSHELAHLQNPRQAIQPSRDWLRSESIHANSRLSWKSALVASGLIAVGGLLAWIARAPLTQTRTDLAMAPAVNTPQSELVSTVSSPVQLWNEDGTAEFQQALITVEQTWSTDSSSAGDLWSNETADVSHRIQVLQQFEVSAW